MKIAHILYDHPANPWLGGGAALRAKAVTDYFLAKNDKIDFISGGFPNCKSTNHREGERFFFTPHLRKYIFSRLMFSIKVPSVVRKLKKEGEIDILVEDMSIFNILFPSLFWKGPMVSLVHNYLGRQSFKKLGIFGIIPFLLERHYLKSRKNYIAVSKALKEHILELNPSANVEVIYNGIDDKVFQNVKKPNADKIGFIGRIEINQKGLDSLVQALHILKQSGFPFKAIIIGGGKDENSLKQMIASLELNDCVELTGRLAEERFERLSECKVVCMPSRFEGWGIAAVEAAAEGIPVIAANIEGLNEAVQDKQTGILITASAQKLAEELKALLQDPTKMEHLSANAQAYAKKFRWENIASEQRSFYERIIENSDNARK